MPGNFQSCCCHCEEQEASLGLALYSKSQAWRHLAKLILICNVLQTFADLDSMRLANRQEPYVKLPGSRSAEAVQVALQMSLAFCRQHFHLGAKLFFYCPDKQKHCRRMPS